MKKVLIEAIVPDGAVDVEVTTAVQMALQEEYHPDADALLLDPPGRIVLVSGSPADGFVIGGPFRTSEEAADYAENGLPKHVEWWVMEVESVDEIPEPAAAAHEPVSADRFDW
jgi:hypothetical protein